jgi:hypothetical protein
MLVYAVTGSNYAVKPGWGYDVFEPIGLDGSAFIVKISL